MVAAAVILDRKRIPKGLNDSKQLDEETREELYPQHHGNGGCRRRGRSQRRRDRPGQYPPGHAIWPWRARCGRLRVAAAFALVDGNDAPALPCPCDTLVDGDARSVSIAAASIIAKVTRDRHDDGAA